METNSAGTAASRIARELANVTDEEIRAAIRNAETIKRVSNGNYSAPRRCPCGESHFSRDLYWQHRLEREA